MESKPLTSDSEKELADSLRVARNSRLVLIAATEMLNQVHQEHNHGDDLPGG